MTLVSNPAIVVTTASVTKAETPPTKTVKAFTTQRTAIGVENPRWRAMVARGDNATTAYTLQTIEQHHGFSSVVCRLRILYPITKEVWTDEYRASGHVLSLNLSSVPSLDADVRNEAKSAAKAAFLSKYRDKVAPFKGPVFLGELRETMRMVRRPFRSLVKSVTEFSRSQRHRLGRANKLDKVFYDSYLEATYGWAPLCSDIESALEAYQRLLKEVKLHPFSSKGESEKHLSLAATDSAVVGTGARLRYMRQRVVTARARSRVGGAIRNALTSGPSADRARELSGFNWNEFVPTIWELIPYSFLIDYTSNVSDVVCGWFTETDDLSWCYQGTEEEVVEKITAYPIRPAYHNPPDVTWLGTSGNWEPSSQRRMLYTREVPSFGFDPNAVNFQASSPSVKQWFNATILGLQRLRSLHNRRG